MHCIQIYKKLRCFPLVSNHFNEPTVNCCKILMASMGFDVNAWGDIHTPERTYDDEEWTTTRKINSTPWMYSYILEPMRSVCRRWLIKDWVVLYFTNRSAAIRNGSKFRCYFRSPFVLRSFQVIKDDSVRNQSLPTSPADRNLMKQRGLMKRIVDASLKLKIEWCWRIHQFDFVKFIFHYSRKRF